MIKKIKIIAVLFAIVSIITIAACSQKQTAQTSANQESGSNQIPASTRAVSIENFAFSPQTITIKTGDTITWLNADSAPHIIASNPHPIHTDLPGLKSESLSKDQSYSFTFTKKGTFGYHCHLHPTMTGTIVVE